MSGKINLIRFFKNLYHVDTFDTYIQIKYKIYLKSQICPRLKYSSPRIQTQISTLGRKRPEQSTTSTATHHHQLTKPFSSIVTYLSSCSFLFVSAKLPSSLAFLCVSVASFFAVYLLTSSLRPVLLLLSTRRSFAASTQQFSVQASKHVFQLCEFIFEIFI